MDLVLRNGLIVTDGLEIAADLAIKDGVVKAIGELGSLSARETVDCTGKILLPGAVDLGLNLLAGGPLDPESEIGFSLATREAAQGGVTTVVATMEAHPDEDMAAAVRAQAEADLQKSFVDFSYHILVDRWDSKVSAQAAAVLAEGVSSFWLAQAGPEAALLASVAAALDDLSDDALLVFSPWDANLSARFLSRSLERGTDLKDGFPEFVEASILRALGPLTATGRARVLVHGISGAVAIRALAEARDACGRVSASVLLPHLCFPASESEAPPRTWPPIRTRADQSALFGALEDGLISAVASAHKPRRAGESVAFSGREAMAVGMATLAAYLPILHSEGVMKWRLSLGALSLCACSDPAKLAGLYPRKGSLQIGSDADIVILNPGDRRAVPAPPAGAAYESPLRHTLFQGAVDSVYLRGARIVADGLLADHAPQGTMIKRRMALK